MSGLGAKNPKIQRLRRLSRRRSSRLDEGAFVIEGPVVIGEALTGGVVLDEIFLDASAAEATWVPSLRAAAQVSGTTVHDVEAGVLTKVLDAVTPPGVAAIAPSRVGALDEVVEPAAGLVVVGAGLADPGNVGTIIRSAEAFGARALVLTEHSVDVHNPKVVRSSAGSLLRLPVATAGSAVALVDRCCAAGWQVLGLVVDGGTSYDEIDLTAPTVIVVGNEAHGLDPEVVEHLSGRITIPMAGPTESLNAAMAATAVLAEAARQIRRRS